jgi:hypothetical protein
VPWTLANGFHPACLLTADCLPPLAHCHTIAAAAALHGTVGRGKDLKITTPTDAAIRHGSLSPSCGDGVQVYCEC